MNCIRERALGLALLVIGCGGAGEEQPGGGGASSGGNDAGGGDTGSGASGGTTSAGGGAPATGGTTGVGPVLRPLNTGSRGRIQFFRDPFFAETLLLPIYETAESPCTYSEIGQCHRISCPPGVFGQDLDAGTVTITSPDVAGEAVATYSGLYTVTTSTLETLLGGEGIVATVAGSSVVPAHSISGTYSPLTVLDSPSAALPVTRDGELVLEFSRADGGAVFAAQAVWNASASRETIICSAVGNPGTLTIGASAMGEMTPGTVIELYTVTPTEAQAGDFSVDLRVLGPVVNPELSAAVELTVE